MDDLDRPGTLDVSVLHGRKSHSADAARVEQIRRDLALTVRERMVRALELGIAMKAKQETRPDSEKADE
jgi:hypothetical protein